MALSCPAGAASAATFYVSPMGNDQAAGTSPGRAWRSVGRIGAQRLRPGDAVLFKAGGRIFGNLALGPGDSGRRGASVTIGAFGSGKATLVGGGRPAVTASDTQWLVIENLNLVGDGAGANTASGLRVYNDLRRPLRSIFIRRVTASGWGGAGVSIGAWGRGSGYSHVSLDRVDAHDNGVAGIAVWAQFANANHSVDIGWSRAWHNLGRRGRTSAPSSGNGIVLGSCDGGRIHNSTAFANGGLDDNPRQGPAGIWTYDSRSILIDHDTSYDNHTGSAFDGDGFDLDQNVTDSVLRDDVSHDNDGPGFLWANATGRTGKLGDLIRGNTSRNDSRRLPLASILIWGDPAGIRVEHNTVLAAHAAALGFLDATDPTSPAVITDNLLVARGTQPPIRTIGSTATAAAVFAGNSYLP